MSMKRGPLTFRGAFEGCSINETAGDDIPGARCFSTQTIGVFRFHVVVDHHVITANASL